MSKIANKKTILAKIESVYGTDPTPTGAANAILVRNLDVQPFVGEQTSRDLIRAFLGNSDTIVAQRYVTATFEVEFAGSTSPGTAPAWGPLLRACAFGQSLTTAAISITRTGSTATATLASHGFTVGATVTISGATETEYNGVQTILTVPNANTFTFTVSGTPDTPATGSPVVGRTSVYAPISSSFESVTLYYNIDGILHKITGAFGSVGFTLNVKQIPVMRFNFIGIYNAPTDTSAPDCTFTAFQIPKIVSTANTTTASLFSYSGLIESMNLDMANDVQYITRIGGESVSIIDRKPSGNIVMELPTIAAKDFFTIANDGTTGALSIVHGLYSGNKVALSAPRVSIGNPSYSESQGIQMLNIPIVAAPNTGNDEVTVTVS